MLLAAALAVAGCKKENVDGDAAGTETGTAAPRWRQSWKSGFALARLKLKTGNRQKIYYFCIAFSPKCRKTANT